MKPMGSKKILIIGGAGFIGHHVALELARRGADVEIIDSLQINNLMSFVANNHLPNRKLYTKFINERLNLISESEIVLHTLDVRDYSAVENAFNTIKPNYVLHFAAVAHAKKSNKDPYSTFDHSFLTLENALDISRDSVERFIYFSSSMVYGNFTSDVVTEETLCNPIGIYGALKYSGEKIVIAYNQVFELPYTIIRPSALYGERCVSRRVGQIFIENALMGLDITVSGDGEDRLDFTYIGDLVDGVVLALEDDNATNQVFNLTYGESRSIGEMVNILEEHFPDVKINYEPRDKLMPTRGTLCVDKAKRLIGYEPKYPLEKGFVKYINWYKEFFRNNVSSF